MVLHQANKCSMMAIGCNAKFPILLLSVLLIAQLPVASSEEHKCGIWFAKSTIPGTGLGMFAGKDFQKQECLLSIGDVVLPLVDMELHQGNGYNFLWDEYAWDGNGMYMGFEGLSDEVDAASPGFGAAINCFMDLVNVEVKNPVNTNEGLHRSKDPGVGGFSTYWNRNAAATKPIKAGNELFASCKFSSYAAT